MNVISVLVVLAFRLATLLVFVASAASCRSMPDPSAIATFDDEVRFLSRYVEAVVLGDPRTGPAAIVVPAWQGRVMTSASDGGSPGYGWVHHAFIARRELVPHMNAFGGEDRFWLGPEGGQFGLFFAPGDQFDVDHWQAPAVIDTEPFEVVTQDRRRISMRRRASVVNYAGTRFDVEIAREVRLLSRADASEAFGISLDARLRFVAFESRNRITNCGETAWTKSGGLLCIWILGMFKPGREVTVVLPFSGEKARAGERIVNDDYFGRVAADRLKVGERAAYFRADGSERGKIGVGPEHALDVIGSYDAAKDLLTIVQYSRSPSATEYVNSEWRIQEAPFAGDVVHSYNDGPLTPGSAALGGFYELETSSPAAALRPQESMTHVHRTMHLQGPAELLTPIAERVLGQSIEEIARALPVQK
ncbi:MAG: DUF6786 family protein [Planctomycetota bacterium]